MPLRAWLRRHRVKAARLANAASPVTREAEETVESDEATQMDKVATAVVILWFIIGMASAILRNEHGYWRALLFGLMGPFAIRRTSTVTPPEED